MHWAGGNGACRFTSSIWSGWAVVMSSRRLEMAQPVVAGQRGASTRARRFGGRLDELTGGLRAPPAAPVAGAVPPAGVISAASVWAAWPWALWPAQARSRRWPAGVPGACPVPRLAPVVSAARPLDGPSVTASLSRRMTGPHSA